MKQPPLYPHPISYQAYLVRLWQEDTLGTWRASAQHVKSGEVVRFADVDKFFAFLKAQLKAIPAPTQPVVQPMPTSTADTHPQNDSSIEN